MGPVRVSSAASEALGFVGAAAGLAAPAAGFWAAAGLAVVAAAGATRW